MPSEMNVPEKMRHTTAKGTLVPCGMLVEVERMDGASTTRHTSDPTAKMKSWITPARGSQDAYEDDDDNDDEQHEQERLRGHGGLLSVWGLDLVESLNYYEEVTDLAKLARKAKAADAALREAIVAERAKGRTLESIAREVGMDKSGVLYICRKAEKEGKG